MAKLNIVWAFDPYSDIKETWQATLGLIDNIKNENDVTIHPYYVLSQEMVHWVSNITPPKLELILPKVEEAMGDRIQTFNRADFEKPKVIISDGFSTREDVDVLNKTIQSIQPDLVVLHTHQRKGISRFFMGSFTESFLLKSTFPTLIIPPNYNFSKKINKTLISTSLHDKEKTFFEEFVSGKLGLKSDVLLYSKVFHPIDAFATSTATALGGAWVSIETFSQEAVVERIKKGENWKKLAEAQGVHVDLKVDDNTKDFVESLMELVEKEGVQLIAMPSFTGGAEAILLGSNAREIIRNSKVPVLVKHYQ